MPGAGELPRFDATKRFMGEGGLSARSRAAGHGGPHGGDDRHAEPLKMVISDVLHRPRHDVLFSVAAVALNVVNKFHLIQQTLKQGLAVLQT